MTAPDLYTAALAQIPGLDEARGTLERIEKARRRMRDAARRVDDRQRDVIDRVTDEVLTGADVPDDLGAQLIAAARRVDEDIAAEGALKILENEASRERERLITRHRDDVLRFLHGELAELLAEVRDAHRVCKGVTTAEAAMNAGAAVVEAWQVLHDAAARYDDIRDVQWRFVGPADRHSDANKPAALMTKAGLYRNIHEFDPQWRERVEPGSVTGGGRALTLADVPWPAPDLSVRGIRGHIWPTTDRVAFVRWLASSRKPRPWVPTVGDMNAKSDEIDAVIREAAAKRGHRPLAQSTQPVEK